MHSGLTAGVALPPTTHAPGAARRIVLAILVGWGLADHARGDTDDGELSVVEVVELLTNELVTNAVEHVGREAPIHLAVTFTLGRLVVAVTDASTIFPVLARPDHAQPRGRGLLMVETLADRWGCDRLPDGKRVWFHLPVPHPAAEIG